jgi:sugar/nucleoside kinase (ribokinase family)
MQSGTLYVAGNVNVDLILGPLAQWPSIGTETVLPHSELRVGGQAGNSGLALAALGARHRVIANMGDDALGRWLRDAFPGTSSAWARASTPTTVTVGLIHSGGERTFFTSTGHLAEFSPAQVLDQLPARAGRGDIVLLCGVFLSPLLVAGGLALCEQLVQRGYALALDTGWPDRGWESVRATVVSWLPFMAHILLNELETLALSDTPDLDRAAAWFLTHLRPGANLVVKCGPGGARAWCGIQRAHCAAPAVNVIDTVGAGDVFNAGYLLGIASGLSLEDSLRFGVTVASKAISTSPRRYETSLAKALRPEP